MNSYILAILLLIALTCWSVNAQRKPSIRGCSQNDWGTYNYKDCRYPDYDDKQIVETTGGIRVWKRRRAAQLKVTPEECGLQSSGIDHCLVLLDIASEVSEKVCKIYSDCREILDENVQNSDMSDYE